MSWRQSTSAIDNADRPSRAVFIDKGEMSVRAECVKLGLPISAIEALPGGGTRVVLFDRVAADQIRAAFKAKLLTGNVQRTPWATKR